MQVTTETPTIAPEPEYTPLIMPTGYLALAKDVTVYVRGERATDIIKFKKQGNGWVVDDGR